MMDNQNTIAAIATGMTNSGIGVVRVSGNQAVSIVNEIFEGADLLSALTHTIHYGFIRDGEERIDEVLVLLMREPRSYTREDTVEIDCHGGAFVCQRILETVIRHGAHPAEPGEFTKRAFLNGRIDLTEAESVIDLIQAKNEYALQSSLNQLQGSMYKKIRMLRERLLHHIAFIEAALDDPEHYELSGFGEELSKELFSIRSEITSLLHTAENGRLMTEGIHTVILGKPNVGKSSLLNLLLGEERSIVTEIAGTTRDTVEEQIRLRGLLLHMIDTAGIRNTDDTVEKIGVERARTSAAGADLILFVIDASTELSEEDREIASLLTNKETIVLLNKSDLSVVVSENDILPLFSGKDVPVISFSSRDGIGMERLEKTIENVFFQKKVSFNDEIILTNVRQKASLEKVNESLLLVQSGIEKEMPEDFLSIDLMDAYRELGFIIGEEVGEDLVNEIFSKFCMGK